MPVRPLSHKDRLHKLRVRRVRVRGRSMEPTLYDGDVLVVAAGIRRRRGRLAVVRLPDRPLSVKRLAFRTPEGWWVERDNPAEGVDSWQVGAVTDPDVVAIVVLRLWPLVRLGSNGRRAPEGRGASR